MTEGNHKVRFKVDAHPLNGTDRSSLWHILSHFIAAGDVDETVHLAPSPPGTEDLLIAERLMNASIAMFAHQETLVPPGDRAVSGIWEMMKHEFHGEIYRLIAARDVPGFAAYLRNAMRETVTHGLGPGLQVFDAMKGGGEGLEGNVLIILDRLASLAEAMGVVHHENPEQGHYGKNTTLGAAELVGRIEERLGRKIGRPAVMGAFGLAVGNQVIDARVTDDTYSAERLKTVMKLLGRHTPAEIGGGLGGCALQAYRAGIPSYTIFDLPIVLLIQGWLLMKVLGGDDISIFGENDTNRRINLVPYWEFSDRSREFDIVFNRDSLPEIPWHLAAGYIAEIAARGCAFLSINQESQGLSGIPDEPQLCVNELVRREPALTCVGRHPYWTRRGYLEELFVPTGSVAKGMGLVDGKELTMDIEAEVLPVPPEELRERVSGSKDATWFVQSGKRTVDEWMAALAAAGLSLGDAQTIVDFGCGCGRALRHLVPLLGASQTMIALDTDAVAVAWVAANLRRVKAFPLDKMPPAPVAAGSVDLIFSHSVFTHLPEDVQHAWLAELARMLKPGGTAVVSFHGGQAEVEFRTSLVRAGELARIEDFETAMAAGGFYHFTGRAAAEVSFPEYYGAAFHRMDYIAKHWLSDFDLVRWLPRHALDLQDVLVLRRKPAASVPLAAMPAAAADALPAGGVPADLRAFFLAGRSRPTPYPGQLAPAFQAALAAHHATVTPADCGFYHTIELPDGTVYPGEWDLRGNEAQYLGHQDLAGKTVIEYGPASGCLSAHIVRSGGRLTVFDLPIGTPPHIMPFSGIDMTEQERSGAALMDRLRNSWWFTRKALGFDATAIYGDIENPPADMGRYDVAVFGAILLHLSNPFRALQRAAAITNQTMIVTDVVGLPMVHEAWPGLALFGPSNPPSGLVHWWGLAPSTIGHMLTRLGFTDQTVTTHTPVNGAPLFTVVGHRPGAR